MPCYAPQAAYRTREGGVTFIRQKSMSGERFMLPCGQCIGCRLEKSRQWAMRCLHEKRLWRDNVFVTLTYSDDHLPRGGSLVKRDLQLFMKRLRWAVERPVRFYACGEYGELNRRPHYHAIVFNCDFEDKLVCGRNGRGESYYQSKLLERAWPCGRHAIGEVTFDSAAYVARYVVKKMTGGQAEEHYSVVDADGVVHEREREFSLMSRRPGIGAGYYDRYGSEVRDHDSVVVGGREVRPPRFYDSRTERFDDKMFDMIRKKRKLRAAQSSGDNTTDRLHVKERVAVLKLEQKERQL